MKYMIKNLDINWTSLSVLAYTWYSQVKKINTAILEKLIRGEGVIFALSPLRKKI